MEHTNFIIYELVDGDNKPFYVGRTFDIKQRITGHRKDANNMNNTSHKANKIRKLMRTDNYTLNYNIIYDRLSYEDSVILETQIIRLYKDNNIKLTNVSEGGEGLADFMFTAEHKTNIKAARKRLFESGYIVYNKNKKLEDIFSEQRTSEIRKSISDGVNNSSRVIHNKGKRMEELYDIDTINRIKTKISETAKNTFTGVKQSQEHIRKRSDNQSKSKQNWDTEMKQKVSIMNKENGFVSHIKKRKNIKIVLPDNTELTVFLLYTEICKKLLDDYNIKCDAQSISDIINGKLDYMGTRHKCNFTLL